MYNRRRIHKLGHQIPAEVVKNYLDSIIQNSTALKSSLFRGGGLDVGIGIPSVVPIDTLPQGGLRGGDEECQKLLTMKMAEISSLHNQMSDKTTLIRDLEAQVLTLETQVQTMPTGGGDTFALQSELATKNKRIIDLEAELKRAQEASLNASGGNPELENQVRDLSAKLEEYEIIADDLANLKRLKQENEHLKKALEEAGAVVPEMPEVADVAMVNEELIEEESSLTEEPQEEMDDLEKQMADAINTDGGGIADDDGEAAMAAALSEGDNNVDSDNLGTPAPSGESQKSSEELLSEFEKMLGE